MQYKIPTVIVFFGQMEYHVSVVSMIK